MKGSGDEEMGKRERDQLKKMQREGKGLVAKW